ncbi:MAG: hypothetical protein EZS28_026534, partial [Streblomastix strix]
MSDICKIITDCVQSNHIYTLDVEFDNFRSNYSVICSSTSEEITRRQNLFRIPNEIIPGLFLGGYMDEDEMANIMKELRITHVLNCIKEYAPGLDGKSLEEYKVPEGVIVHHMGMEDDLEQQINFSETYQFIDSALNGCQKQSQQSSSSSS